MCTQLYNILLSISYKELFCASRPYGVVSRPGRAYISPGRAYISPGRPFCIFLVHLVVYLGLGSPLVLCTRNFIATGITVNYGSSQPRILAG